MNCGVWLHEVRIFWTGCISIIWQAALIFMCCSAFSVISWFLILRATLEFYFLDCCLLLVLCFIVCWLLSVFFSLSHTSQTTYPLACIICSMLNFLFGLRWYIAQNRVCCTNGKWDAFSLVAISWPWWHVFNCYSSTQKTHYDKPGNKVWLNHTQTYLYVCVCVCVYIYIQIVFR